VVAAELACLSDIQPLLLCFSSSVAMLGRVVIFSLIFMVASSSAIPQSFAQSTANLNFVSPDTLITLREAGLLIRITADGTVIVEGQTFDFDIGRLKMKISTAEVQKLVGEIEKSDYFSLKNRYVDEADGCPRRGMAEVDNIIFTSVTLKGKSKSVVRYERGCLDLEGSSYPQELAVFEEHVRQSVGFKRP
jgi:hypothetical protein